MTLMPLPRSTRPLRLAIALALHALTIAAAPVNRRVVGAVGYDPDGLNLRLEHVQSVDISRACGNISRPWAYRGQVGREMALRSYGRHHADSVYAQRMVTLLMEDARVDTATEVPSTRLDCDPAAARPMYLLEFVHGKRSTYAVLWFELGVVLFFDAEEPLGRVAMGARADSIWATLAELLPDDPLLRKARPESPQGAALARLHGDRVEVDEPPDVIQRVAPKFPFTAQELGIDGVVFLEVKVGADGAVQDALVVEGHRLLRDEALKAVWKWKFDPARRHGEPVAAWVALPVRFTLE
jgi:TonB family protein